MNRAHRTRIAIGSGLTATALAVAASLPAQAASGWRVVSSQHYGGSNAYSGLSTVVAPASNDAWALGGSDLGGATAGTPVAEHWTGQAWQTVALPSGLTDEIFDASAPASNDIWAVSLRGHYVLHWNGTTWSVAKTWAASGITQQTGVTAFSPTNVWVFGGPGAGPGLGTWHLHGTTWTQVTGTVAGGLEQASAVSAMNMWAIGSLSSPSDIIAHYNGSTWQQVTSSAFSGLRFNGIVALSATNIWVSAVANSTPMLVHFNGQQWQRSAVPYAVSIGYLTPDGHGGLWISGDQTSTNGTYALHRSGTGAWSRQLLAAPGLVGKFALIPGGTSVWAAGSVFGPTSGNATIWRNG